MKMVSFGFLIHNCQVKKQIMLEHGLISFLNLDLSCLKKIMISTLEHVVVIAYS